MLNKITYAVNDNGFAAHKLVTYQEGKFHYQKVRTIVGMGARGFTDVKGTKVNTYDVEGTSFVCDERVGNAMDLRNADYAMSKANRALVAHSLKLAGLAKTPIVLGTTLPVRDAFGMNGSANSKHIQKVKNYFTGKLATDLTDNSEISTLASRPYVEGLAAFYDWAIDDQMNPQDYVTELRGPVLIVDVGGSTTDIVTILAGDQDIMIDHERSGSDQIGVLDSIKEFKAKLNRRIVKITGKNPELSGGVSSWQIEKALETGRIEYRGDHDVSDLVHETKVLISEKIISQINSRIGDVDNYQAVIFAGGGAIFYGEQLKALTPDADIRDEYANARGALKYMYNFDRDTLLQESQALKSA